MAEHNQFDIDNSWEIVEVTSPRGDKQVYKINSVSKHVMFRTRIGDGNSEDWRGCNVSYDAIKRQNHRVLTAADLEPHIVGAIVAPVTTQAPVPPEVPKAKPIDLASVAPFAKKQMNN